jgi:nucleoside-diphosphate-sugar epimerase
MYQRINGMIVGNGMLAKAFEKYKDTNDVIIFASGISNSCETDDSAFEREKKLLQDTIALQQDETLAYFSTCSITDPSMEGSRYVLHKLEMENLIQQQYKKFYIFRLPQVVGKTTSPTIIHFLYDKITKGESFDIWANSTRNLIDVQDIVKIVDFILQNALYQNEVINIASPFSIGVKKIVHIIEEIVHKKANYCLLDKGASYVIDISKIISILPSINVQFNKNYIEKIIEKYYL